jgi:hypothetical protein
VIATAIVDDPSDSDHDVKIVMEWIDVALPATLMVPRRYTQLASDLGPLTPQQLYEASKDEAIEWPQKYIRKL